jgi:aminopeptidase N
MRLLPLLFLLFFPILAVTQPFDPTRPPNTYRNADNPDYWKNRPPYEGYWQQDVHYVIKARLDDVRDVVEADMGLTYWNNSPDTLGHVFFHLYQEAFVPGSYALGDRAQREDEPYAGTTIESISIGEKSLSMEKDNTVLRVLLDQPLPPGEKITFRIHFTTHWSMGMQRRMKLFDAWGWKHYDAAHWYPRIAVYDRRKGWDTQQHLGHEFYGDFGTFDVDLDLPHHYILDATGVLQNEEEVLPPDLRAKLDIRNFKDKPWNEKPSVIIQPEEGQRKTWKFHAENVHDFAFTADPTYRIGEAQWNGVRCIALAQEPHASGWQNAADYTAKIIEVFSTDFGVYAYPKMIVADARDGMEYPMLTLDGGRDPDYRSLLVHEVGHNWFFGMLGNNETYRAFLDEGFTQFLTGWGLERIDGDTLAQDAPGNFYERKFREPQLARESEVYYGYQHDAVRDQLPPINVHSDDFGLLSGHVGGYGHVYYKTAVMLYNLQYVLGDELFLAAMKNYVQQWRICHPYPEDMRQSFTTSTGADLDWFFDQWIESDWRMDYAVKGIKRRFRDDGQVIHLRRKGEMQSPIDLRITARDGRIYDYHIPNTWFVKKSSATVLPRWYQQGDVKRDHLVRVDIPSGIESVVIDTTHRMADANKLNDRTDIPVRVMFDHHMWQWPDRRAYEVFARPDIWWNAYDGIKLGFHANSSYMKYKHKVHFTAWLNTGIGQSLPDGRMDTRYDAMNFNFRYENGIEKLLKGASVNLNARLLEGLERYSAGWNWQMPNRNTEASVDVIYFIRKDSTDLTYLLYPDLWQPDRLNGRVDVGLRHKYQYSIGSGDLRFDVRNSSVGSAWSYSQLRLTAINQNNFWGMKLRTRLFGQYGTGNTAPESALYLAGGNPEEMMENKYVRSIGFVPYDWLGLGGEPDHFHFGGGLNLRGYAGYLAPELDGDGNVILTYAGNTGTSASAELDLDGLVRFRPGKLAQVLKLNVYLFGDVGSMSYTHIINERERIEFAEPRADAGAGVALTIKRWGPLVDIKPLTLRFDMPLFLSALPAGEEEHFAFRYVVGIGRSF